LTKNSGALLLQQIAKDTKVEDMQIVNFHPGSILTQSARSKGFTEDNWAWDHGKSILLLSCLAISLSFLLRMSNLF